MRLKHLFMMLVAIVATTSCIDNMHPKENKKKVEEVTETSTDFKFWTWMTADSSRTDESYTTEFKKYSDNGIDAVLINTNADADLLGRLAPLAVNEGLEVHAWMFTMNRPGDSIAMQHPEWYVVNRNGESSFETRPYVDYYQFLCPTRKESREHVLGLIDKMSKVEGVTSFHLDYIRFPDVFLPIGLLPKYDLVQDEELAEYDFCYCDACIAKFEEEHHKNPLESHNTAIDMEWKQFRLNQIKAVVDDAYKIVHENGKLLTGAVFPYPEMADHMVRQRWDKWNIDMVLPMIYNNFYNEEIDWIGFATRQGVKDLEGSKTELHTGIYVPEMSPEQLAEAIQQAKDNGAKGAAFFDGNALTDEQLAVIKAAN